MGPSETEEKLEWCIEFLNKTIKTLDSKLQPVANIVLKNKKFVDCRAATKKHHMYVHGLPIHTAEVMEIALAASQSKSLNINRDVVILGALWHDYGKIYEYEVNNGKVEYSQHGLLIYHIARGYAEFINASKKLNEELRTNVGHVILSHHGRKEWGATIEPKTPEAYLVHHADMLSAQFLGAEE